MKTSDVLRHQIINSLTAQHTDKAADEAIALWALMATRIISIVGDGGFNSLYARSVFLAKATYPWLDAASVASQNDRHFSELNKCLNAQEPAQVRAANSLLLITFTDILASLIGEQLTTSILRSAWELEEPQTGYPNDASDKAADKKLLAGHPKELKNE